MPTVGSFGSKYWSTGQEDINIFSFFRGFFLLPYILATLNSSLKGWRVWGNHSFQLRHFLGGVSRVVKADNTTISSTVCRQLWPHVLWNISGADRIPKRSLFFGVMWSALSFPHPGLSAKTHLVHLVLRTGRTSSLLLHKSLVFLSVWLLAPTHSVGSVSCSNMPFSSIQLTIVLEVEQVCGTLLQHYINYFHRIIYKESELALHTHFSNVLNRSASESDVATFTLK